MFVKGRFDRKGVVERRNFCVSSVSWAVKTLRSYPRIRGDSVQARLGGSTLILTLS